MTRVPKLAGALAGAHYSLIAAGAGFADDKATPSTLAWLHDVNVAATVALSSWLPPPQQHRWRRRARFRSARSRARRCTGGRSRT